MNQEDRKIEITLKPQTEEDKYAIRTSVLGRQFLQKRRILAAVTAFALIAGLAFGLVANLKEQSTSVSAKISFGYEGAERGEDPHGGTFDINAIMNASILDKALEETGLATEKRSGQDVKNALTISACIPEDIQEQIGVIKTIAESNISALKDLVDLRYIPTDYQLTLDARALDISGGEGEKLLNEIINQYRQWFIKTYSNQTVLGNPATAEELAGYDYAEALDVLESKASETIFYLTELKEKDSAYRSVQTGYTFSDLISQVNRFMDVELNRTSSIIQMAGLTDDMSVTLAYCQNQLDLATQMLASLQTQEKMLGESIDSYKKDSNVAMNSSGVQITATSASQAYDELVKERTDLITEIAEQNRTVFRLQKRLENMRASVVAEDISAAQRAAYRKQVDEQIPQLAEKLAELCDQANTSTKEYYETVAFKTACQMTVPPHTYGSGLMGVLKAAMVDGVIALVLACFVDVCIVVLPPLVKGELLVRKKKEPSEE